MCIIALAYQCHAEYPVVMLSNRDEFYQRPSAAVALWPDQGIVGGKDLTAGGSWLAIHPNGRFAAVTNYRSAKNAGNSDRSRGHLVTDVITTPQPIEAWLQQLDVHAYAGFNLLAGTLDQLWFLSNRHASRKPLTPGLYGLSNGRLDSAWPKVKRAKEHLRRLMADHVPTDADPYLDAFVDPIRPPVTLLPDTGVGLEWERLLSPIFIQSETYGTRATSLLTIRRDGLASLTERRYNPKGEPVAQDAYQLSICSGMLRR